MAAEQKAQQVLMWKTESQKRCVSLIDATSNVDGWTHLTTSSIPPGMSVYERREAGKSIITVRGEIDGIQAPAWDFARFTASIQSLPIFDKMAQADKARVVETFDEKSCIMYCPYNVPWPLDTRDFLYFQHWHSQEDVEILFAFSVERPDVPEVQGNVRGKIYDSGYVIRPTGPNTCKVSYIVCIDPMGWVPAWANTKTAEQVYSLAEAKKYFASHPITVSQKPQPEVLNICGGPPLPEPTEAQSSEQ